MIVKRAATAGFCMGVSLALHKLDTAILNNGQANAPMRHICTFGPIIHNPQVLEDYERQGVRCINAPGEATAEDRVIIRAHGVPRGEEASLTGSGAAIVDATCPKVKRAQLSIFRATRDGSGLLLFGEADHPEVRGLISYANGESHVFTVPQALDDMELDPAKSWVLAAQTTQDSSAFAHIRATLEKRLPRLKVLSTICDATGERQKEARAIASGGEVQAMVVIGGRASGNTRRLAALAAEAGITTYHVEDIDELTPDVFAGITCVGLTAGASTPRRLIDKAEAWLRAIG